MFRMKSICSIYGNKSSRVNQVMNGGISPSDSNYIWYTSSGKSKGGQYNLWGFTAHENFNLAQENIVPTLIHNPGRGGNGVGLFHIGGIERRSRLLEAIPIINETILRNLRINTGKEAVIILGGD